MDSEQNIEARWQPTEMQREYDWRLKCPVCKGGVLEFVSGDFGSGVFHPDGTQEVLHEEFFECDNCGRTFDELDVHTGFVDTQTKGKEMDDEQVERIEIEDDQRCGECGSTEGGNCFYCQDGLG